MTSPTPDRESERDRLARRSSQLHDQIEQLVNALSLSNAIQARLGGLDERALKIEANMVKRTEMDEKVAAVETNARLERKKSTRKLAMALGVIGLLVAGIVVAGILVVHRFSDDRDQLQAANQRVDVQSAQVKKQSDDLVNIQVQSCLGGNQARVALRAYLQTERKAEVLSSDNTLAKQTRIESIDQILRLYPEPRKSCDPEVLAKEDAPPVSTPTGKPSN